MPIPALENEWLLLQNQFDSYEKYSLMIKLVSVGLLTVAYFVSQVTLFIVIILLVLWGQDAIWKTFQSRIESRLLLLEKAMISENEEVNAYQFNSQYLKSRPSTAGLIKEYACQALRPTIAFPHALLLLLTFFELAIPATY